MKLRIEVDKKLENNKVIIRCREKSSDIEKLKDFISDYISKRPQVIFYRDKMEYFLDLKDILFFETDTVFISAHIRDDIFQVKYKLYELEEILPEYFIRASKSTILNVHQISSISKNLRSSSLVTFSNTYKTNYVSRYYYKALKNKINEVRIW